MSETLIIDGTITTTSPIQITDPARDVRWDPERNRILRGFDRGFPAVATRSMRVFLPDLASERDPLGIAQVPIIPSNGLRGRLRRCGARIVENALKSRNAKPSMELYQAMHSGAFSSKPSGEAPCLDEVRAMRNDLFAGLYGSGSRMMPSRWRAADGIPVLSGLLESGMIPESVLDACVPIPSAQVYRLTEAVVSTRLDDLNQFLDPGAEETVRDYETRMEEEFALTRQRAGVRKQTPEEAPPADAEGSQRGLRSMAAHERIVPGVCFYMRFMLVDATDAQTGLFLYALRDLCRLTPKGIGGHIAHGYGRFSHNLTLRRLEDGAAVKPFMDQAERTELALDEPLIASYVGACDAALGEVTPESLAAALGAPA